MRHACAEVTLVITRGRETSTGLTSSRGLLRILCCVYILLVVRQILDVVPNAIVVREQVLPSWEGASSSKTDTRQMSLT
jgi:hypothetical protein